VTAQLLNVTVEEYWADPWMSLNSTVAKALILETPAHAKEKHPRLMADQYVPRHTDAMDEGTALHQMLLGDDRCDILDYDSFRSKDAQAARDASRAAGRTPLLRHRWDEILLLGDSLKRQVEQFPCDPPLFVDGYAEQTIIWDEGGGVTCRARLDWLHNDYATIDDLKKSRSAQPRAWQKAMWRLGYEIQAAFYIRGVKAAFGRTPVFRLVAIEPEPPYALSVHTLSPDALKAAQDKVDLALELWAECLETGNWPAYPQTVHVVELPEWMAPVEWELVTDEVPF